MSHVVFPWCQSSAPNVGDVSLSTITRKDGATGTLLILALISKSWNLICPLWFTERSPLYLRPLRDVYIAGFHTWFLQQWQLGNGEACSTLPLTARMSGALTHLSCLCQKSQRMAWSQETIYWPFPSLFANLDNWLYPSCIHIFLFYAGRRSPALFHHSKVQRESFCLQQTG